MLLQNNKNQFVKISVLVISSDSREASSGFIFIGSRQYRVGEFEREILSIRKFVMNQRNKRGKVEGYVFYWFVVVVELKKNRLKDLR